MALENVKQFCIKVCAETCKRVANQYFNVLGINSTSLTDLAVLSSDE